MAPVLSEWVPEGHLAHFISDLVEGALDLGPIYADYEVRARLPALRPAPDAEPLATAPRGRVLS
jgi:hypothetical protein